MHNGRAIILTQTRDGVHMNATAYAKILEYIRTHPLVKE